MNRRAASGRTSALLRFFGCCLVVLAVTCLVLLPTSVVSASEDQGSLNSGLTLGQAREAFETTWRGFDSAYQHVNLVQVARYVTPEMLGAVVGQIACGCGPTPEESLTSVLSVPPEDAYPYSFLAQISVKVPPHKRLVPIVYLAVFTKATESSPWLLAFLVAYSGTSEYLKSSQMAGPSNPTFDYGILGGQLAQFFASYVNTGGPPVGGGPLLEGWVKQTVDHYLQVKRTIEGFGATQNAMSISSTDQSPLFAYLGGDIVCGALHSEVQITTPPNHPTIQSKNRTQYGPLLAPGSYTSLDKQQVVDFCDTIKEDVVVPISFFGWTYSIVGVEAA
jgi:hypothetical protein